MNLLHAIRTATMLASLSLLAGTTGCGPGGFDPPPRDTCLLETTSTVASLEIGDGYASYEFEPWGEVHSAEVTTGVQGSPMVPFLVRVTGAEQDCLPMQVRYQHESGATIASFSYPVQLYPQDDGSMVSERHYVILDGDTSSGTTFLEVTVGGVTEVYTVNLQVW